MPLDPSIIMGYKPTEIENPVNALTRALQAKAAMGQADLQGLQIQQAKDSATRASNFRAALADQTLDLANQDAQRKLIGIDPEMGQKAISAYNDNLKTGADIKKSNAQAMEADAKANESRYNLTRTKWTKAVTDIASMGSKDEALKHLQAGIDSGDLTPDRAQTIRDSIFAIPDGDAGAFAQWKANTLRGLTSPDVLVRLDQDRAEGEANRNNQVRMTNIREAGENSRLSVREAGENGRQARTIANGHTQVVPTDDGVVVVDKDSATARVVTDANGKPVAGVTKPMNQEQSNALLFASRAKQANDILNGLGSNGVQASVPGSRMPLIGGIVTAMSPDKYQQLDQAKRNFVTAILRRESGAAISSSEFDTADKQYFPQIGDSNAVIEQKAQNRDLAIRGIMTAVPEKRRSDIYPSHHGETSTGGAQHSPAYQEYLDAYNSAKGNPQVQAAITARARQNGVVK